MSEHEKPPGYVVRVEVLGDEQYMDAKSGAEAQAIVDILMKTAGVDRQTIRIYVISEWRAPE